MSSPHTFHSHAPASTRRQLLVATCLVLVLALGLIGGGLAIAAPSDAEPTPDTVSAAIEPSGPVADPAQVFAAADRFQAYLAGLEAQRQAEEAAKLQAYFDGLAAQEAQRQADEAAAAAAAQAAARASQPGAPADSYWDRMAWCETGGNWHMQGSAYSGGVGFANSTWSAYGGREFAANAGQASREQQIIVANRVATQGYHGVPAVGYSAWGCTARVGRP